MREITSEGSIEFLESQVEKIETSARFSRFYEPGVVNSVSKGQAYWTAVLWLLCALDTQD